MPRFRASANASFDSVRVVLLVRSMGCGGAERQLRLLAARLARHHEVTILTFYEASGVFERPGEESSVRVISLGKRTRWDVFRPVARFVRTIEALKPDAVYAFMNTASMLALFARLTKARPRIVWGIRSSNMDLSRYGLVPRVLRRVECALSGLADLAISNSEAGKLEAIRDGYRTEITVVPNGIDTGSFVFDEAAGRRLRQRLGIPENRPLIGMVARHDPMKGYEVFLEAAALFHSRHPETYFLLVGDGNAAYTESLKQRAKSLQLGGKVVWAGRMEDVGASYSAMDVFTSSSIYGEGFSNSIGEAMSCGLLCVVTDVGDSKLIVGTTGIVVAANSPQDLAQGWETAIQRIKGAPSRHRALSRERIITRFSDNNMVTLTEAALANVVAGNGSHRE
jgi:glycosyltransferase involved in cell wall biosynthesis